MWIQFEIFEIDDISIKEKLKFIKNWPERIIKIKIMMKKPKIKCLEYSMTLYNWLIRSF